MNNFDKTIIANYWIEKLRHRPLVNQHRQEASSSVTLVVEAEGMDYFRKLAAGNEMAEFTVLITLFNLLAQRYFEACPLVYANSFNGARALPLLFEFNPLRPITIKQCLQEVKEEVQAVYRHSGYDGALFQNQPLDRYASFGFSFNAVQDIPFFPFSLSIKKLNDKGLELKAGFSHLFTGEQVAAHFLKTYKSWISGLEQLVQDSCTAAPVIDQLEKERQLKGFNDTHYSQKPAALIQLFEEQALKTADAPAVEFYGKVLTYRQLNARANRLSRYLSGTCRVEPGDLVGVKLERDELLPVAILSILKAGAAYVPLDVSYPAERLSFIEQDSQCRLVIDREVMNAFLDAEADLSDENPGLSIDPGSLAYVIYTSGTTGKPKGVMITNANAVELVRWAAKEFDPSRFEVVYGATSHCFDLSVFEMFFPLSVGKKLRMLESPLELSAFLKQDSGILLNTVPSAMRNLLEEGHDLSNVNFINLGGEAFPVDIAAKLLQTGAEIRNVYGPTEDTVYSTCYKLTSRTYHSIPIGKPICNTQAYILDACGGLLPEGVLGRLFLSGAGLSKGYLNRPGLTAEKFIPHPFIPGARMYDTGDLAKWLPGGDLEFHGRRDLQVKIRGYRIELEEIENAMMEFSEQLTQSVVEVAGSGNDQVLVGFYTSGAAVDEAALREYLGSLLPSYMVPSVFRRLSAFPLNLNGKVDRNALRQLTLRNAREKIVAPRSEEEAELVEIWKEVLGEQHIGIRDHFFELGGHSLMISQVINRMHKRLGKGVSFQFFYTNPTVEGLSKALRNQDYNAIPKAPAGAAIPATPSQRQLWLLSQLDEGMQAYRIMGVKELKGNLDATRFAEAFRFVACRHSILRTFFRLNADGALEQHVLPLSGFDPVVDMEDFSGTDDAEQHTGEYINAAFAGKFNLSEAPLFRASLLKTGPDSFLFLFSVHHILADGWSIEILTAEVLEAYRQLLAGGRVELPELPVQFADYAAWLQQAKKEQAYAASQEYWLNRFSDAVPVLKLPSFRQRPPVKTFSGNHVRYAFSTELSGRLKQFSQEKHVTLFALLMMGVKLLLSRYSNQHDITLGTPVAGREHPDLEGQVGPYLNTLAIRTQLDPGESFLQVLEREQQLLLEALSHQSFPFDTLVEALDLERDPSRSPLFDVMIVLQNQQQLTGFRNAAAEGISVHDYPVSTHTSKFDLSYIFGEHDSILNLEIEYNTDIYEEDFVRRMFPHLENLFLQVLDEPGTVIREIGLLTPEDKNELLQELGISALQPIAPTTAVELFREQAVRNPGRIALVFQDRELSYAGLHQRSGRLALFLSQQYGLGSGDLAAVSLERSEWLVIALLAVMKTGAAYVPVDPAHPKDRISHILHDTKAKVIIGAELLEKAFAGEAPEDWDYCVNALPGDPAYVLFTSGSTGTPKGVMIRHESLVNFLSFYDMGVHNTSLTCNFVFDVSVLEIFAAITSGSTLFIPSLETVMDPGAYARFLYRNRISHCYIHPMHLEEIAGHLGGCETSYLQRILIGVESIRKESIAWYHQQGIAIMNGYGPTEATICATAYRVDDVHSISTAVLPIGRPLPNYGIYILNEGTQVLQPRGVIGELCISGAGLALGYLNRDDLTQAVFEPCSFALGGRIYRTGDLARWLPDGNLEFIGRKDFQVKIRGNRVEPGEIEYLIGTYQPCIGHILVEVKEVKREKVLVAYYTTSEPVERAALREYLKSKLPGYMVPNYFVELPEMPLTSNGKIDRRKLPPVSAADLVRKEYQAPANATEEKVVLIWQEVLRQHRIGVHDDFFELGGNSLLMMRTVNEYQRVFRRSIDFKALYTHTTLLHHAALIDAAEETSLEEITPAPAQELYGLSPSQLRYWLINSIGGKSRQFNIFSEFPLPAGLDFPAFEQAFNDLLARHEALRTIFVEQHGTPMQKVLAPSHVEVPFYEQEEEARKEVFDHVFDLDVFPLVKVAVTKRGEDHLLLFNIHHIISDGWSMGILSRDLMELYTARTSGSIRNLPDLTVQYKDYAVWLNNLLASGAFSEQKIYWESALSGRPPYLQLPADNAGGREKPACSHYHTVFISESLRQKLATLARENWVSQFAVFTAAFKVLLNRLTSEEDIIIGIPAANRNHFQLKNTAGCFLNTLMVRNRFDAGAPFSEFLQQVNHTLSAALAHQNYPFEQVLDGIGYPKDQDRFPLSSVFLNLLDFEAKATEVIADFTPVDGTLPAPPKFDFECYFKSYANGYSLQTVYDGSLFNAATVAWWMNEFLSILSQVAEDASIGLEQLDLFARSMEQEEALMPANAFEPFTGDEVHQSMAARFEKTVRRFPESTAVYCDGRALTYAQLNNNASRLAAEIMLHPAGTAKRIALLLDHDETCVAGMLGVLKAGYSYVPIDVHSPLPRIRFILEDSGAFLLVCSAATWETALQLQQQLPELKLVRLSVDPDAPELPALFPQADPLDEAYVLYTSGSTGQPKGVVQIQRNVLHYIRIYTNNVHIAPEDNLSVFSTYTFDASVKDIYGAILNGATVSLYNIREHGLDNLAAWLRSQEVSIIHMVPTIYRHFLKPLPAHEILETVRLVDLGGEPCYGADLELFRRHFAEGAFLVNDYGPTEATIVSQNFLHHRSIVGRNKLSLGRPVQETEVFLLDEQNNRLGIYQEGEIVFSSDYLSLGYLNREEVTSRAFVSNPFSPGKRMYRSGDIGRMLPDGSLEFVCRKDTQVKLNGVRIELAEIEYHLEKMPGVEEAVVMVRELEGNGILTAYVRKSPELHAQQVSEWLLQRLPKSMVPALYIPVDAFPLTRTGKIDRGALPQPAAADLKTGAHEAPVSRIELELARIWGEILGTDAGKIGTADRFFEMGGNSLLAIRMANQIGKSFGIEVKVRDVFSHSTISELAQWISLQEKASGLRIPVLAPAEDYALSTNQRRLWIACQAENSTAYNIPGAVMLQGAADVEALGQAYGMLAMRHESLRTILVPGADGLPRQKILSSPGNVFEAREADCEPTEELKNRLVSHESNIPFDLNGHPLVRVRVITFPGNRYLLLVVMHHIISDGWSMDILIREWISLYAGIRRGSLPQLPPLAVQYKEYAAWQQQYLQGPAYERLAAYWKQRLAGDLPVLNFPFAKTGAPASNEGAMSFFAVSENLYARLQKLAADHQASLFTVLFSAFNLLLHHVSRRQQQIILGTSVAGRRHESFEQVIGFFVNTLGIKTTFNDKESFLQLMTRSGNELLDDFEHQDMPFDELLTLLAYERIPGVSPVFQARFVLNAGRSDAFTGLEGLGLSATPVSPAEVEAKFNLSLVMHYGKELSGAIEYRTPVFEKDMIQLVIEAYLELLEAVADRPHELVGRLDTFNDRYQQHIGRSKNAIQDNFLKKLQVLQKKH